MTDRFDDKRINEALELLNEVARDKKQDLQQMVTNKYSNFKSLLEETGDKVRHDAEHAYRIGREKIKETAAAVDESAHKHPWQFIGGAALGALILGYMLGRSKK